jgi:hypothetical protein
MINDPAFLQRLEAKRKVVAKAKKVAEEATKKAEVLEAELRGWEEAASCVGDEEPEQTGSSTPTRGLSAAWKGVIGTIAKAHPKEFSLIEIGHLASAQGISAKAETIRTQMHGYAEEGRGYVERTSPGMYRATIVGAAAAEVELGGVDPNDSEETAGADQAPAAA